MVPPWKKWLAKKGEQVEKVSGQQALSDEKSSSSRKAWRQWLEKQKSPHPPLPRLTTDSSTTATKTSADDIELGEKWESLTEPEYVFRPPGQLGLSRINVPLGPPMKTSAPVRVLKVPSEAAFAQATASTPYNFAGSMLNRAIPNALHELPKEHRDLPLRLIIFKLPSTGSTYFTELLQSIPQVHIAKELLTGADATKSTVWLTAQMTNALTHPMRGHNQGIESGVHIPQAVLGFTVCPIVLPNADFRAPIVQLKLPSSVFRVIALCRSNHVKHAVGLYRAAMLRAKCHSNNIRADTERKCTISNSQLDLSVSEFKQHLRTAVLHTHAMLGAAYSTGLPVYEITYEDLQRDHLGTLSKLFSTSFGFNLSDLLQRGRAPSASTKKFTTDDLRKLLANYDSIEEFLIRRAPCLLPQLRAIGPESFAHCGTLF